MKVYIISFLLLALPSISLSKGKKKKVKRRGPAQVKTVETPDRGVLFLLGEFILGSSGHSYKSLEAENKKLKTQLKKVEKALSKVDGSNHRYLLNDIKRKRRKPSSKRRK